MVIYLWGMSQTTSHPYEPLENETLGAYLKRLRLAASQVQGKTISQDMVAEMASHRPAPQRFTGAWLSVAESDGYKHAGGDKLRTLASIYLKLLRSPIPPEWLLTKAGHEVTDLIVNRTDDEVLDKLLRQDDVLALIGIVGQLIELGYADDVRLLVTLAQRYLSARKPEARAGDLFDDPTLSAHVENYMEALGLI
jgi:hypothetical protein